MSIIYCMNISNIGSRIISATEMFVGSIRALKQALSPFTDFKRVLAKCTRSMTSVADPSRQRVVGYGRQTVGRPGQQQTVQGDQRRQELKSTVESLLEQANTPEKRAYLDKLRTDLEHGKISNVTASFIIGTYMQSIQSCPDYRHVKIRGTLLSCNRRNNTAAEKTFIIRLYAAHRNGKINDDEAVSLLKSYGKYLSVKKDNPQMAKFPNFEEELALLRELDAMKTELR